jgi:hypothetical protein
MHGCIVVMSMPAVAGIDLIMSAIMLIVRPPFASCAADLRDATPGGHARPDVTTGPDVPPAPDPVTYVASRTDGTGRG